MKNILIRRITKVISSIFFICKSTIFIFLKKPLKGKYYSLELIARINKSLFKYFKNYNDKTNVIQIRSKKKIRCGFVVCTGSMWNFDELFHLLENHENYDVSIIVAHILDHTINNESSQIEYNNTMSFFKSQYPRVLDGKDALADDYDIFLYLSPFSVQEENIDYAKIPLNKILLHSSYSYMLSGNMSKLNLWLYHLALYYYADTNYYKKLIESSLYSTESARFIGFPKMDQFYTADYKRRSSKKIIIYAPHHSVNYEEFKSATFEQNYLAILELARKYSNMTYWIYKPHPWLRSHSVIAGVFKSEEEYDSYVEKWDNLENADVIKSGEYFSLFKESDAMITDSVSFLAEYQFTHKPLLLLESGKEKYNEFGNSIVDILYKCSGNDISAIESFIEDVISGKDEMKDKREEFFENNLSYRKDGKSANYRIYQDILNFTSKDE